jgi:hypothetical protein
VRAADFLGGDFFALRVELLPKPFAIIFPLDGATLALDLPRKAPISTVDL